MTEDASQERKVHHPPAQTAATQPRMCSCGRALASFGCDLCSLCEYDEYEHRERERDEERRVEEVESWEMPL